MVHPDLLTFQPNMETIDEFLRVMKPTVTPIQLGAWISIRKGPQPPPPTITAELRQQYADAIGACEAQCLIKPREKSKHRNECKQQILQLASENGDVRGKWIICPFSARADRVWSQIGHAMHAGQLGHYAKVATMNRERPSAVYPICIYVEDFNNLEQVHRILRKLQDMNLVKHSLQDEHPDRMTASFKPDVFTRLGMYHHASESGDTQGYRSTLKIDPVLYRIDHFEYKKT